ncbi:MAG: hypothetical protein KKA32_17915 [Actinobacteria bacterium]|nr:hypothetical protein [Actinomycetota bacterium]
MTPLMAFLHFVGVSILVGGELLIAMIAMRAQKDDNTLTFFVGFLYRIAGFMWAGVILSAVGGTGLIITLDYPLAGLFVVKLVLVGVVIGVSLVMLLGLPKVKAAAAEDFSGLRSSSQFKQLDLISRINLLLVLAILVISVVM